MAQNHPQSRTWANTNFAQWCDVWSKIEQSIFSRTSATTFLVPVRSLRQCKEHLAAVSPTSAYAREKDAPKSIPSLPTIAQRFVEHNSKSCRARLRLKTSFYGFETVCGPHCGRCHIKTPRTVRADRLRKMPPTVRVLFPMVLFSCLRWQRAVTQAGYISLYETPRISLWQQMNSSRSK